MRLTLHSKAAESSGYRPDIDGLRAVAVVSVVLYHAGVPGFSGGFVGVDIFFVISGYLITRVLEDEMATGRFSFAGFYERRMRRIFPALFTMALVCTALAAALFPPQQFRDFGRSLLAMAGFVSNVFFMKTSEAGGYFGETSGVKLLLHTWSLSVEEQFYLFFPIGLLLLNRYARSFKYRILVLAFLISFAVSYRELTHTPIAAFYLLPSRAWELLTGALLSVRPLPALKSALARGAVGLAGLAAIVYAIVTFADGIAFPGPNALYPCFGAMLLLYSGEGGPSIVKSVMGFPPLVFLGAISYSLYLWHWPLIALRRYFLSLYWIKPEQEIAPLAIALILAILSFEFVESPFRKRRKDVRSHQAVWVGVLASALIGLVAGVIVLSHGLPGRFSASKSAALTRNYAEKEEFANIGACANYQTELKQFSDAFFCEVGHSRKNILFWGDSHVSQLYPLLKEMQQSGDLQGKGLVFAVAGACPPTQHINLTKPGFHCDTYGKYTLERAAREDIDTVFIQFCPYWVWNDAALCKTKDGGCIRSYSAQEEGPAVIEDISASILELKKEGKRVIVGLPFPFYDKIIPDVEIRNTAMGRFARLVDNPYELSMFTPISEQLKEAATQAGAEIYKPRDVLCPGGTCLYAIDGISLYSDQSHIAISQLGILRPGMLAILEAPPAAAASSASGKEPVR